MEGLGLCADVTVAVGRYLGLVDQLLPGRVTGYHLVDPRCRDVCVATAATAGLVVDVARAAAATH